MYPLVSGRQVRLSRMVLEVKKAAVASWLAACEECIRALVLEVVLMEMIEQLNFGKDPRPEVFIITDLLEAASDVEEVIQLRAAFLITVQICGSGGKHP